MASLLEEIAARARMLPPALAFPDFAPGQFPAALPAADEPATAAQRRQFQKNMNWNRGIEQPAPDVPLAQKMLTLAPGADSAGIQLAMDDAPAGTGVPFSTQAGMMAPPVTLPEPDASPVPMPMARPPEADLPPDAVTDVGARSRAAPSVGAPMQLAPQLDAAAAASPSAAVAAPAAPVGMFGEGSILDRIRTTLGDNSNTLLALGAGFAGAPNIGQGISRAAAAAIPARAADINQTIARQTRGYTTKALIEAGVPVQQAIAAQADPDLKKALIKNYIEDRASKIVDIGTDRDGRVVKAEYDPFTKSMKPIDVDKMTGRDATTPESDVTGPDYLTAIKEKDPRYARQVESIINGDMPFPTGKQAQTPMGQRIIKDVLTVEPGSTPADFANRQATSKAYTSGLESRVTRSVNTTLHHAATLEKAINKLDNFNSMPGVLNPLRKMVSGQVSPEYQKARAAYETAVANFAKELDFVVSGGRPTVSGTKHQMEGFDAEASKNAQMEKLRTGVDLLKGRLDSHADGFGKAMKRRSDPTDFIDPPNRGLYNRLIGGEHPAGAAAAPAAVAAPAPGRYVFDPATGTLVPAK
jgi:hypothetical protein